MEIKRCKSLLALGLLVCLPIQAATITVTEILDDDPAVDNGECSLREAIITANTDVQVDSCVRDGVSLIDLIIFDPATDIDDPTDQNQHSFLMSLAGANEDDAMTGDLDVLESLRIVGNLNLDIATNGLDLSTTVGTVIVGNGNDRIFQMLMNAQVEIENVAMRFGGGVVAGGALLVGAGSTLTLRGSVVGSNDVTGAGGAIHAPGNVAIENSMIAFNSVEPPSNFTDGFGGAVNALGNLTITDSVIFNNEIIATSDTNATGGNIRALGNLDISNSIIGSSEIETENGQAHGGIIYFGDDGADMLSIQDSGIVGGDLRVSGSGAARGAGLYHAAGQANIQRTNISGNDIGFLNTGLPDIALGGGIYALDPVILSNVMVTRSGIDGADIAEGGGIYLGEMDASLVLNNVTVTDNDVQRHSGDGSLGRAGGLSNAFGAMVTVSNSIIADNTVSGSAPDCRGDVISAGYNLIGDSSDCNFSAMVGTDIVGTAAMPVDPKLTPTVEGGALGLIGLLFAPFEGSPAIDAADMTMAMGGSCENVDIRSEPRPQDNDGDGTAVCEMGAYEGAIELPEVMFNDAVASPVIRENQGSFTVPDAVILSEPAVFPVTVDIMFDAGVSDATLPADFDFMPITVTFAPGETSADIEITVVNDGVDEPDETVVFNLVNPSGATLGMPDSFTATLTDPPPPKPDDDDDDGCSGWEYLIFCAGGGCNMAGGNARFDPVMILLLIVSAVFITRRKFHPRKS